MRGFVQVALAATLVAGAAAQPHVYAHRHAHAKKHAQEKRDAVTVTSVVAATVTEYVLDGQTVEFSKAEQGIKGGDFIVVGSSTPTFTPPPPASTPAAQFFEHKESSSSSSSSSSSTPTPTPTPEPTPTPTPTPSAAPVATGIDEPFPTGDAAPDCSVFPSAYGAVPIDWLNTGGWTSLQQPNSYIPGVKISNIVAPISGGCEPGMFCSYACPAGYQKTQWPEDSQGATGQSVGGLWCNSNGKLELTRPSHKTICAQGAGGVTIKNSLSGMATVCRTDYPASENMVIPLVTTPGGEFPLTNPSSADYFWWQGNPTTAQYYVNKLGLGEQEACVWTSAKFPKEAGNWAPINIGVGKALTGITFLSIFPNWPTTTATLDFNIRITGDVNSECKYENGVYTGGSTTGCTTAFNEGGSAVIEFYN
jgi:hypothetical protein